MIDYINKDLFNKSSINKQLKIQIVGGGVIDNSMLYSEDFTLEESISSSTTLRFGSCESSMLKFRVRNGIGKLTGKTLTVSVVLNNDTTNPFTYGTYKVVEDEPSGNRSYREVIAYDALYEVLNADVSSWYNTLLPSADSTVTLKQFRDSFFTYFGITQRNVSLVNDSMVVAKTIDPDEITGKRVLNAICEINGCFGIIDRNNQFKYIVLSPYRKGLYPDLTLYPDPSLFPSNDVTTTSVKRSNYISVNYKDFDTKKIDKLQIRQEENDVGAIVGTGTNCYVIQDNFLVYGKNSTTLSSIASNVFSVVNQMQYMPATVDAVGNPCIEVGDSIKVVATERTVYTFVLQRTLKGIQALYDTYQAQGEYEQSEKTNSINDSIIQLKGKTNRLVRNVNELSSTITDVESGLSSRITQNASSITSEVTRATTAEGNLSSRITQTESSISSEVTRASTAEGNLSTRITQTESSISTKVSKGSVISEINQTAETVTISASRIDLNGLVTSTAFTTTYATIADLTATNVAVSGKASVADLQATNAEITKLYANEATLGNLIATKASVDDLSATNLEVSKKASISSLNATNVEVAKKLTTTHLSSSISDLSAVKVKALEIENNQIRLQTSGGQTVSLYVLQATIGGKSRYYLGSN